MNYDQLLENDALGEEYKITARTKATDEAGQ